MSSPKKVNFGFEFVVPPERVMDIAKSMLQSGIQDERDVAKALLDTTEVTIRTQNELRDSTTNNGSCDLAPYFDHWIGDAIDAAARILKSSVNDDIRNVAKCLIGQSKAISQSKESFLREIKRVGIPPAE